MRFTNWILSPGRSCDRFRPRLSTLEDRTVPATFTVDIATDVVNAGDGKNSLREAIASANGAAGPDEIAFASALNGSTITLGSSRPAITGDTAFIGPGAALLGVRNILLYPAVGLSRSAP